MSSKSSRKAISWKEKFTTHLNFRPLPNTFCNFSVAGLMDGDSTVVPMRENENGRLVKDDKGLYGVDITSGLHIDSNISFPLKKILSFWKFDLLSAIQFRYQYIFTRFPQSKEEEHIFSLGLGTFLFK